MLQTVKGYYYKGKIELEEDIGVNGKVPVPVLITFLEERKAKSLATIETILKGDPLKLHRIKSLI